MISKRTIVWFVLLVGFSASLAYHRHTFCNDVMSRPVPAVSVPDNSGAAPAVGFDCHQMMETLPIWVDICSLGWLVSVTAFLRCLYFDLRDWTAARRRRRKLDEQM